MIPPAILAEARAPAPDVRVVRVPVCMTLFPGIETVLEPFMLVGMNDGTFWNYGIESRSWFQMEGPPIRDVPTVRAKVTEPQP